MTDEQETLGKVLEYLGLLETLCIGIQFDIYDADTAYELYGGRIVAAADSYAMLIEWRSRQALPVILFDGLRTQAADFKRRMSIDRLGAARPQQPPARPGVAATEAPSSGSG